MYNQARRKFDQMLRLVSQYRKKLLKDTNFHLAQQLEMEDALCEAEQYYCEAGEWESAVNMWRANDSWNEAIQISKLHMGVQASQCVAYAWALSTGGAEGSKLLTRFSLIVQAIDYAVESGDFSEFAQNSLKSKQPEVHLKQSCPFQARAARSAPATAAVTTRTPTPTAKRRVDRRSGRRWVAAVAAAA